MFSERTDDASAEQYFQVSMLDFPTNFGVGIKYCVCASGIQKISYKSNYKTEYVTSYLLMRLFKHVVIYLVFMFILSTHEKPVK